jgi:hypothetical protein
MYTKWVYIRYSYRNRRAKYAGYFWESVLAIFLWNCWNLRKHRFQRAAQVCSFMVVYGLIVKMTPNCGESFSLLYGSNWRAHVILNFFSCWICNPKFDGTQIPFVGGWPFFNLGFHRNSTRILPKKSRISKDTIRVAVAHLLKLSWIS